MVYQMKWSWLWSAFLFFGCLGLGRSQDHILPELPVEKTKSGLQYQVVKEGDGRRPDAFDTIEINYQGFLLSGEQIDSKKHFTLKLSSAILGWQEGIQLMREGAVYRFTIPAHLAFGEKGQAPNIPSNATLIYDIELGPPKEINRIIAKVDDELITGVDLSSWKGSLNDLIEFRLIMNALKKAKLSISNQEVEQKIESHVQTKFDGDRQAFVKDLRDQDITFARFTESIEQELALDKLIAKNYFKLAKPTKKTTSEERQSAYQQIAASYSSKQTVTLSVLALSKDRLAETKSGIESQRETLKEIQKTHSALKKLKAPNVITKGGSITMDDTDKELINQFKSMGGKSVIGIGTEQIKPSSLTPIVAGVVAKLNPGEFSEVFEDGLSFKIVLLKSRTIPQPPSSQELTSQIEQVALEHKWKKYYDSLESRLRNEATIKIYEQ